MKIPKEFKFQGLTWTVKEDRIHEESNKYAITIFKSQEIILDSTLTRPLKEQTFLHELLHVIIWGNGLDHSIEALRNGETEESIVNGLSAALYGLLKDIA